MTNCHVNFSASMQYSTQDVNNTVESQNMLPADRKLCNVIRRLLNPCSKLADAKDW